MEADRPGDADMPPDDHPDRRDDQDGAGDHAARAGNARAETRTRQEYYADLRVTVSKEESAVARQVTAEEQAAAEDWQEKVAESRWMWGEYQRKWPPAERPAVDRSKDPAGSWRVDRNRVLDGADNSRVDTECDRIAKREEEKISPALRAIESQDPDRRLVGFEHRLKGRDRIKEKVYDRWKLLCSAEEAVSVVSDTIRYTFQYREARYTQGVWTEIWNALKKKASSCTHSRIPGPMISTKASTPSGSSPTPASGWKCSFIPVSASRPSSSPIRL